MKAELALYIFGAISCIALIVQLIKHYVDLEHIDMNLHPLNCMECGSVIAYGHEEQHDKTMCIDCTISFTRVAAIFNINTLTPEQILKQKWNSKAHTKDWEYRVRQYCKTLK